MKQCGQIESNVPSLFGRWGKAIILATGRPRSRLHLFEADDRNHTLSLQIGKLGRNLVNYDFVPDLAPNSAADDLRALRYELPRTSSYVVDVISKRPI